MDGGVGVAAEFDAAEEEDDDGEGEAGDRHDFEDVEVGEHGGLLLGLIVDDIEGGSFSGLGGGAEGGGEDVKVLLKGAVKGGQVFGEAGEMELRAASEEGDGDRNA